MNFAEKGARAFTRRYGVLSGFDYEDFVSAAYLGLMVAARKWRPDGGATFSTYAFQWTNSHMMGIMQRDRRADGWSSQANKKEKAKGKKGMQRLMYRQYPTEFLPDGSENESGFEALLPPIEEDHIGDIEVAEKRRIVMAAPMSARERIVMDALLRGVQVKAIALKLGVSRQRVESIVDDLLPRVSAHAQAAMR